MCTLLFLLQNVAMSLLTAIPGKTGYVTIGGKQCEVKASTPKVDDGLGRHAPREGWRPNQPPRHNNYHNNHSHHHNRGNGGSAVMMSQHHPPPQKHYYRDNDSFNSGSNSNNVADGRNYDELYAQPPQASGYQQPMPVYGRGSNYQQNYNQNVYNSNVAAAGYGGYPTATAGQASSWEASYPATASVQGYNSVGQAQYAPTATPESGGYYDPYAVQQYPLQYANDQYGNAFVAAPMSAPPVMMGGEQVTGGYADNDSYYGGGGASVPSHGDLNNSGAFEPYPQQYVGGGDYGEVAADQYE